MDLLLIIITQRIYQRLNWKKWRPYKTGNGCHRLVIIQKFEIDTDYPLQIVGIHKKLEINGVKAYLIDQQEITKYISKKYKFILIIN